jgi:hypothetical protein
VDAQEITAQLSLTLQTAEHANALKNRFPLSRK